MGANDSASGCSPLQAPSVLRTLLYHRLSHSPLSTYRPPYPVPVNCGGQKFTRDEINGATKEALMVEEARAKNRKGYNKYPERYENHEKLFVSTSNPYEYPFTSGGVYSGNESSLFLPFFDHSQPQSTQSARLIFFGQRASRQWVFIEWW
ncbi:hypothetical protein BO82DRAFT_364177 [Aspergillus uvarum CBS 121591]|uniref:Uncharacterized protein n=1 Tax=Aspergillus uvarum CBS 121591 TaxID=1448315 RepID=A0A319CB59_9EURO|nr:hypothetical protein BO82DRAFT_364177 [Aspergillus uvarum CBS 121591]PYH82454.1 hypothetical protein BO82DRAFT_364177 [Aspergillus uvarum CBS 121591]